MRLDNTALNIQPGLLRAAAGCEMGVAGPLPRDEAVSWWPFLLYHIHLSYYTP